MNGVKAYLGRNMRQYGILAALVAIIIFFQVLTGGLLLAPNNLASRGDPSHDAGLPGLARLDLQVRLVKELTDHGVVLLVALAVGHGVDLRLSQGDEVVNIPGVG